MNKLKADERGATLVEMIVVLVIVAILATVAVPSMIGFVNDARGKAYITEARTAYVAAQVYMTEQEAMGVPEDDYSIELTGILESGLESPILDLLEGSFTEGAKIERVASEKGKITKFVYVVDNYKITIETGTETTVQKVEE